MQAHLALLSFVAASAVQGATALFPSPMHLTRTTQDPLTGRSATVEEYYFGNRVITVRGDRSVIVDYDKRNVTEVDRANARYSVTSFEDVANAHPHRATSHAASAKQMPSMERLRSDQQAGRGVEVFSGDDKEAGLHAEIAVDSSFSLSRSAFDIVIGSAYPNDGGPANDLARGAARHAASATETYGLPMEQKLLWSFGGRTIAATNAVTRVGEEGVPPELIAIPPGAKQVDSRLLRAKKLGDEIESLSKSPAVH